MKKRLAVTAGIIGLTFICCSMTCGNLRPNFYSPSRTGLSKSEVSSIAEWTIMIFMNGDNNLEPDALINFRQLAQVGSTDKVNAVVQFDRIAKYAQTQPDWSQTLR